MERRPLISRSIAPRGSLPSMRSTFESRVRALAEARSASSPPMVESWFWSWIARSLPGFALGIWSEI